MLHEPVLRKPVDGDIEILFEHQLDPGAAHMAAFTSKEHKDRQAYIEKWKRLLMEPTVHMQIVTMGDEVAGVVSKFEMHGEAHITYALAKKFWRQGICTTALRKFLLMEKQRPIYGHTAFDNIASARVLEKCGFKRIGTDRGYANARGTEIEEFIYRLDGA